MNKNRPPFQPHSLPLVGLDYNDLISAIGSANRAIAGFDALLKQVPDSDLLLRPLAFNEAIASSRIENIHTTLEGVFRHEVSLGNRVEKRDDIGEVINYRQALLEAVKDLDDLPLAKRVICQIHQTLLSGARGTNKNPGKFRTGEVSIQQFDRGVARVIYVPPEANKVPDLFGKLEHYIHYDEKDPLVQAAIIHAQFEIIHPFLDGNGRTGRILIPLFLYYKKVLDSPNFYLSEYLENQRDNYYLYLRGISEDGDWLSWINFFLTAITEQAKNTSTKIQAIQDLYKKLEQKITLVPAPKHYMHILNFIFSYPVFNSALLMKQAKIPKSTCAAVLKFLVEDNVIRPVGRSRNRGYIFDDLLGIIHV